MKYNVTNRTHKAIQICKDIELSANSSEIVDAANIDDVNKFEKLRKFKLISVTPILESSSIKNNETKVNSRREMMIKAIKNDTTSSANNTTKKTTKSQRISNDSK